MTNLHVWLSDYAATLQQIISDPKVSRETLEAAYHRFAEVSDYLRSTPEPRADAYPCDHVTPLFGVCPGCGIFVGNAAAAPAIEPPAPHYGGFSQPSLALTCECGGQTFSGSIGGENPTPLTCDACGRAAKSYFSYT
jgi:hypothetical protein